MTIPLLGQRIDSCSGCPLGVEGPDRCPFSPVQLSSGSLLCAQGERIDRVFLVREGLVTLSATDEHGRERRVSLRGPGSLLGSEPQGAEGSPAEVRALTNVRACTASNERFESWLGPQSTPVRRVLMLVLEELARRDSDLSWQRGDVTGRVARFLSECLRSGTDIQRLPKQVVARTLGIRAETLSRCLRRLEDKGLLAKGGRLRVLDVRGLQAVAASP